MTSGEVGMGTIQTQTVTHTITVPVETYTTVIGGATQTVTQYRTFTVTSVETRVVTITTTIEKTVTEMRTITNTVTKTVTVSAGGQTWGYKPGYSAVILIKSPYDAFIFIGRG
jgi:hypothetical protein